MDLINWDTSIIELLSGIQREELRLAWLHDVMYEKLSYRSYKWNWAIAIMGFLISLIAFITVAVNNDKLNLIGSIFNGIIGLAVGFLTRQSEKLNLETNAENHRRTAAAHTSLFQDIEEMKKRPTKTANEFLFYVRSTSKSIREASSTLYISETVKQEFDKTCKEKGIELPDTFTAIAGLSVAINPQGISAPPTRRGTSAEQKEPEREPEKEPEKVKEREPEKVKEREPQKIKENGKQKGYDSSVLKYELGRLAAHV